MTVEKKPDDEQMPKESFSVKSCLKAGLLYTRIRFVLWILLAVFLVMMVSVGNRDAGSYMGYTAGSLLHPDRYEDTAWTSTFGDSSGLRADDVNEAVEELRNRNLPEYLGSGALLLLTLVASWGVGLCYTKTALPIGVVMGRHAPSLLFFMLRYRRDRGGWGVREGASDLSSMLRVGSFAIEYALQPGCEQGVPGTLVDAKAVSMLRESLGELSGKVWLIASGLRLDESGHVVPLSPLLSIMMPVVVPEGAGCLETAFSGDEGGVREPHESNDAAAEDGAVAGAAGSAAGVAEAPSGTVGAPGHASPGGEACPSSPNPGPPAPSGSRFCPRCGAELGAGARFCPRCGVATHVPAGPGGAARG